MREPLRIPVEPWEPGLVVTLFAVALVALLVLWLDRHSTSEQK